MDVEQEITAIQVVAAEHALNPETSLHIRFQAAVPAANVTNHKVVVTAVNNKRVKGMVTL